MTASSIKDIIAGKALTVEESASLMHEIVTGQLADSHIVALLTALTIRGFDVDVLDGFSSAALEVSLPLDLGADDLIDVCGTGGDGKSSFNISTAVAFVLAGAGYRIAKHGNVAVSSACGSSNVLQELGFPLSPDPSYLRRSLETCGVCFIHAPLFHPALKRVASIRRELGFRTIFNALGPLINPARVRYRYSGVYSLELQRLYSYLLHRRQEKFAVVYTLDGYDEVSLTAPARVLAHCGSWEFHPEHLGVSRIDPRDIAAPATPRESAQLIESVLNGSAHEVHRQVVVTNAALALWCYEGAEREIGHYRAVANEAIDSGKAYNVLKACREV